MPLPEHVVSIVAACMSGDREIDERWLIEMGGELQAWQARLDALSVERAQVEELARVNREAAAAMREELSQVMKEEGRRALWLSIAAGVPIGVATSILASYMWGVFAGR